MGALGVGGALQIGGDLLGMFGGAHQQSQNNQAISQLTGGLNSILGTQSGAVNQLLGQYSNFTAPQLQALVSSLQGQGGTALGSANTALGQSGNFAQQLAGLAPGMAAGSPYTGNQAGIAGQLANFQGLTPAQIAQLSTQAGNAGRSAANTMLSQSGGVANPALLAQQLADQANQTGMQTASSLGSLAAGENLQGLQSAGSLFGSAAGQQLSGQEAGASALGSAGGLFGNIGSQYAGLNSTDISGILSALEQQGSTLGTAMNGLSSLGSTYGNLLGQTTKAAASTGNPYASGLGSIGSLISGVSKGK